MYIVGSNGLIVWSSSSICSLVSNELATATRKAGLPPIKTASYSRPFVYFWRKSSFFSGSSIIFLIHPGLCSYSATASFQLCRFASPIISSVAVMPLRSFPSGFSVFLQLARRGSKIRNPRQQIDEAVLQQLYLLLRCFLSMHSHSLFFFAQSAFSTISCFPACLIFR